MSSDEAIVEPVIGLEVHCQLATERRLFSPSPAEYAAPPNRRVSAYDVAMPGTLPVVDQRAVELAVRLGLALDCTIDRRSRFDRKHYFYPDLPKGYQITQYDRPICTAGELSFEIDGTKKTLSIRRIHLEEDAGKTIHDRRRDKTLVDYNRAGVALVEIVTEPELRSPEQAEASLRALHRLVVHLGVSDGNLEEGSFRCDANVSIRCGDRPGARTELKNLNSFRFVRRALAFEIERQRKDFADSEDRRVDETRGFDPKTGRTFAMRTKEASPDYRYMPDPDLLALELDEEFIEGVRDELPETPSQRRSRWVEQWQVDDDDARVLVDSPERADFFDKAASKNPDAAKQVAKFIRHQVLGHVEDGQTIDASGVEPADVVRLCEFIDQEVLSTSAARRVLEERVDSDQSVDAIVERLDLRQIVDEQVLGTLIDEVLENHSDLVDDYRRGKTKLFGHFMGLVMRASSGKADPNRASTMLRQKLEKGDE